MTPAQYGHLMENLAENTWTAGSDGRLITYVPVLDSHAVDRAVTAQSGGPPLFVQVKAHRRHRPGDRLAFAIPTTDVGTYQTWICLFLEGDENGIRESYLVPGADLQRHGEHGILVDGRPCLRVTLSPTSPTWRPYLTTDLAHGLESLLAPTLTPTPTPTTIGTGGVSADFTRSQEQGQYFEETVVATILRATADLALYRPAVDVGRDLLVQRSNTGRALYLQVKGSEREDRPGLARFQVRRRSLTPDPALAFLFCFARAGRINPVWLVTESQLIAGAAPDDQDHLSFEAHLDGRDPRWEAHRITLGELPQALLVALS